MRISTKSLLCIGAVLAAFVTVSAFAELSLPVEAAAVSPTAAVTVPAPVDAGNGDAGARDVEKVGGMDILKFVNGDALHGVLVSIDPSGYGLRWKHVSADKPIEFSLKAVAQVKLAGRQVSGRRPGGSRVRLTNMDLLNGKLISMDDKELALDTWYAGKIAVKRPMLKSLDPNTTASFFVYRGPTDIDNWTFRRSGGAWEFKKGAFYSSTSYPIARKIEKMPAMADIRFDAAWQYSYPSFYFSFFSDNLESYSGNSYALRISGVSLYLYRYSRNRGSQNLGNVNVPEFSKIKKARFNILADRKNRQFTLLVNGKKIKQWSDAGEVPGTGNNIVFDPEHEHRMKISNITISRWDGTMPKKDTVTEGESKEDIVRFVNEDKVSGRLVSIMAGNAKFETSYATLDIPLERAVKIDMSSEKAERARRNNNDIRAHFAGSGAVTVGLAGIVSVTIEGSSENFGTVKMPLGAFELLEFNIYRDKDDEDDETVF